MINKRNFQDLMIIDREGKIIFADVGDPASLCGKPEGLEGMRIDEIFTDAGEDYPAIQAVREGAFFDYFEIRVTTKLGVSRVKTGCVYPISDGNKAVGALELSNMRYDKNHISNIAEYAKHLIYRANNTKYLLDDIITGDPVMVSIKENIEKIAVNDANVLIYGETGTGKELVAQAIHNSSRRYAKKFVSINCGALPAGIVESLLFGTVKGSFTGASDKPGLFELAEGGTLFLDEINSLDLIMQVKILKAIESKEVRRLGAIKERKINVRIVTATNQEPYGLMKKGKLKPDLFYRLSTIYFKLPSLSQREGDVLLLANYFRNYFNYKMGMSVEPFDEEVKNILTGYRWPGNIRELRNAIEGAFAFSDDNKIKKDDLPKYILEKRDHVSEVGVDFDFIGMTLARRKETMERLIIDTLYENNGRSLTKTAGQLGISKQLLKYKMGKGICR